MKKFKALFLRKKLSLAIILSIIISSCNGQVQTKSKENNNRPLVVSSLKVDELKDPLFFIDGQLCQHLREIFQDSKGNLWFGTNVYDLMLYNGDSLKYITEKDGFSGGRVTGIVEDDIGNVWFGTSSGLIKYNGKSFTTFNEEDGLLNSEIWSLIIDYKGIFWIGHNEGLSRYDGKRFENIPIPKANVKEPRTKYSPDRITAIVEHSNGDLWLGTDGYGICKYDGKSFTSFTSVDGLADNTIHSLMMDSKDNLWIGTYWDGLSKFDGENFNNFTKNKELNNHGIHTFFEDSNGDIWIAIKNNGVCKYSGDIFTHYSRESFSNGSVLSIFKDKENRFWFGGWGGLFRYEDKLFSNVTKDGPWN